MTAAAAYPVWGDPAAWRDPPRARRRRRGRRLRRRPRRLRPRRGRRRARAGASVVGIDAGPIAGGAAGRNGGFLLAGGALFHHAAIDAWGEERAVGIYRESLAELDRLAAELGPLVRRVGSLRIPASPEEAEDCALQLAALERHGFPARAADGPTGAGVFIPGDGSVQPLERCRLLAGRVLARGARLFCDTPAVAIAGDAVAHPAGTVALPGGRRLRRRLDRAAAAGARRPGALLAPADARHRAGRARADPLSGLRQLGLRVLAAAPGRQRRARRRARHLRRRGVGARGRAGGEVQALLDRLLRERIGRRRAGHAPLGGRDRLHATTGCRCSPRSGPA